MLGLKWAVTEKFRDYLLGTSFKVYTDSNPLAHFQTSKLGALEQRWAAQLAVFDFTVHYKPGRVNRADALSRMPQQSTPVPTALAQAVHVSCSRQEIDRQPTLGPHSPPPLPAKPAIPSTFPTLTPTALAQKQREDPTLAPVFQSWPDQPAFTRDVTSLALRRQHRKLEMCDGVLYCNV
jgi:hypothetical protein